MSYSERFLYYLKWCFVENVEIEEELYQDFLVMALACTLMSVSAELVVGLGRSLQLFTHGEILDFRD